MNYRYYLRLFSLAAPLILGTIVGILPAPGQASEPMTAKGASSHQVDNPWDMNLLGKPPPWTALERPKMDGLRPLSFAGPLFKGKPTRIFAWLGLPKLDPGQRAPAMVLIHGGGGTAFEEWVRLWNSRGYAAIAMDTCGQLPVGSYGHWYRDQDSGPPGWGGFDQIDWPRQDQWTYHAVASVILAHSLIRSLPEVDPDRTGVTGISWGGYLTCLVASVDSRFKLAVPVYGCGYYRETVFADSLQKLSAEQADRWMNWWDPSVYLSSSTIPMLWVTGSNDFAYPLTAWQRSYRRAQGPRTLCVRLRMPHGHGGAGENPEEIRVFADSILRGGEKLTSIRQTGREGAMVWAAYDSKAPLAKAELNYTKDEGRWQDRKWASIPANLAEGKAVSSLPEGTRVYYFNLFDGHGCVVSTEHEMPAN